MTTVKPARWQRIALYAVGAWTALGGISALADPGAHAATFFGTATGIVDSNAALLVFRIAYAQLIAWGLGYVLAARVPAMWVPILGAGAVGKIVYFSLTVLAFAGGSGTFALLLTGIGDLMIAAFFAFLLVRTATPFATAPSPAGPSSRLAR